MTLNHNYGYFSGVGSGIAGNYWLIPINVLQNYENTCKD